MQIRRCPDCGGRLVAEMLECEVTVKCNACGQELGTFDRADKPVTVVDDALSPLFTHDKTQTYQGQIKPCPFCGEEVYVTVTTDGETMEYQMKCSNDCCGAQISFPPGQLSYDAWNRRYNDE